jgi:hypothetical protein
MQHWHASEKEALSGQRLLEQNQLLANKLIGFFSEANSFDVTGFSKAEWMQHYIELWSEEIPLSNGNNLLQEWAKLQAKLEEPGPQEIDEMRQQSERFGQAFTEKDEEAILASARRRKAKILGSISIEELPDDVFEHQVRRSVGMSMESWNALDPHTKGYEMALYAVNNMMEGIKNYHQQEELRAKQEKANQQRDNRKPRSAPRRPANRGGRKRR